MNDTVLTMVGSLTDDPELKYLSSGVAVAKFRVASTPRKYNAETKEWADVKDGTLFMSCTAWRQMAENVAESLQRGARVVVTGRLRQRSYETQAGEKRTVVELEVDEVGPSLKYATAKVQKMARSGGNSGNAPASGPDEFATAPPPQRAAAGDGSSFDDEPPF